MEVSHFIQASAVGSSGTTVELKSNGRSAMSTGVVSSLAGVFSASSGGEVGIAMLRVNKVNRRMRPINIF